MTLVLAAAGRDFTGLVDQLEAILAAFNDEALTTTSSAAFETALRNAP